MLYKRPLPKRSGDLQWRVLHSAMPTNTFLFKCDLTDFPLCRASELQNKVATQCLQLHGGWGYMWEYQITKAFVDARVQPIYGGTNEIMKELIARSIVGHR
ncbi:hypothetical protein AMELA_G00267480 [Ameiurus melas]|uniref:Acyl-CoA dehydrogenase/oxidase C-terminal domain-containing protein n=1 Tax=Ameiurus melas TaxID=219545 RepID=A0A7J5ZQC4_AMEME|nr:hypothetical protein AMELA_G00267480 [Ameiurus melas]